MAFSFDFFRKKAPAEETGDSEQDPFIREIQEQQANENYEQLVDNVIDNATAEGKLPIDNIEEYKSKLLSFKQRIVNLVVTDSQKHTRLDVDIAIKARLTRILEDLIKVDIQSTEAVQPAVSVEHPTIKLDQPPLLSVDDIEVVETIDDEPTLAGKLGLYIRKNLELSSSFKTAVMDIELAVINQDTLALITALEHFKASYRSDECEREGTVIIDLVRQLQAQSTESEDNVPWDELDRAVQTVVRGI
ncbi:MAG: hypothetical protein Q8P90_03010 [bacterium]|nr:hypothetical protein [bacterium]